MIRNVAELLQQFVARERAVLDKYELSHGPTIGAMYEGLTRDILDLSLPKELDLQVVSGFAYYGNTMSGELDCMLVTGAGERIPHTSKFKWPIENVLAVFEVKKSMSADEISDSYNHLREVSKLHSQYIQSNEASAVKFNINGPRRVFSQITGAVPPRQDKLEDLSFDLEMIYHTLVCEFVEPVRIVVGHHGWKKEKTLRDHIYKLLQDRLSTPAGMGVGSFPQLIIGGDFSLVKANGLPYLAPLIDGMWPFFLSSSHNPLRILLELVFTKIEARFSVDLIQDDSIEQEAMSICLRAKAVKKDDQAGWDYLYDDLSEKTLKERGSSRDWEPTELSSAQFVIINKLCNDQLITLDDPSFISFAEADAGSKDAFIDELLKTHLVALDGQKLCLTTVQCKAFITADGKFMAGEDNAAQVRLWLGHHMKMQ